MNSSITDYLRAGLIASLILLSGCTAVLIGGAAVTTIIIANDNRSVGTIVNDSAIELKIANKLADDAALKKHAFINPTSTNGIVLLIGSAPTQTMKEVAGRLAASVEGVRQVVNQIEIGPKPGTGQISSDTYLATKVKTLLFSNEKMDATRINVEVFNDVVYLMGVVSQAEADQATAVVRKIGGVKRVVKVFEITR